MPSKPPPSLPEAVLVVCTVLYSWGETQLATALIAKVDQFYSEADSHSIQEELRLRDAEEEALEDA